MTSHLIDPTDGSSPDGPSTHRPSPDGPSADRTAPSDQVHGVLVADDPLAWVSDILWPAGDARLVVADRGFPIDEGTPKWWATPSAEEPKLLVPADSMSAAKRAVRRYHDGFSLGRWARSAAAEFTMASAEMANRLLGDEMTVIDGPADATSRGVLGGLHELFERDSLRFAISLAAPKTNRKPVIQILDDTGMVLGWAKVAWNSWTNGLVANEASWLGGVAKPPLVTPTILANTVLARRRVVVASSVAPSRRPRLRRSSQPDPAVLHAIAALGTRDVVPIRESTWWTSVEDVLTVADESERTALERAVTATEHLRFTVGAWHGDFTPWNVMTVRGIAEVVDWEFAADGAPFGFDLCHHHTQVAAETLGLSPDAALDRSARLSPQGLASLGVDPHNQIATWNLYLVELARRTLALRAAGVDTSDVHHGRAAFRRLGSRPNPNRKRRH